VSVRCGVSVRSGAFNERVDEGTGFSGFFKFFCVLSRSEQRQTTTMSVGLWLKSNGLEEVDGGEVEAGENLGSATSLLATPKIRREEVTAWRLGSCAGGG
jgi:hypothetical protein